MRGPYAEEIVVSRDADDPAEESGKRPPDGSYIARGATAIQLVWGEKVAGQDHADARRGREKFGRRQRLQFLYHCLTHEAFGSRTR